VQEENHVANAKEDGPPRHEGEQASAITDGQAQVIVMLVEPRGEPCCNSALDNGEENDKPENNRVASTDVIVKSHDS